MTHPIDDIETVLNMAKDWRQAGRLLSGVRHISESDMATMERVLTEYRSLIRIIRFHASNQDQQQIDDMSWKRAGGVPSEVLTRILEAR